MESAETRFRVQSDYAPAGDQPKAIEALVRGHRGRAQRTRPCSGSPAPARPSPWPT
ncbi:MAG: hypothetical protein U5L11_14740 [Arhodomonas sp.]|nr:hypothetical protein [Arhodomonas sp.]